MNIIMVEQGGSEWQRLKLGVGSASNASRMLAKKGTDTRNGYINELVGQIATLECEEINAKALEWGKANEGVARAAYEFTTGNVVEQIGFIYGNDKRVGCSPDGIIPALQRGLEIKNPLTAKVHVDFLAMDKIKTDYVYQVQFSMWVTGFETWDFCSYHPKFKSSMFKAITVERDNAMMERFTNEVGEFNRDMDAVLAKLGLKYGDQWLNADPFTGEIPLTKTGVA